VLKTENPEYYWWGKMNTGGDTQGKDIHGMVVYPYEMVDERDRHIVAGRGLNNVIQMLCLVQHVKGENNTERSKRLKLWNLSEEIDNEETEEENEEGTKMDKESGTKANKTGNKTDEDGQSGKESDDESLMDY
jgi:hypothetical protein